MDLLTLTVAALVAATTPVQLASPGLTGVNVDAQQALFFSDHFAQQLSLQEGVRCTTASELSAVLGLERQKAMMGCQESTSCLAELANALGADGVVTGSVGNFQGAWQINLKVIGATSAAPLAQFSSKASSESEVLELLNQAARRMALSSRVALKRIDSDQAQTLRANVLEQESSERSGLRRVAWIPAVSGAVLAGAGGFFFLQARANAAALTGGDGPGGAPPSPDLSEQRALGLRDAGVRNQTLGAAGVTLGVAALATGAAFYLFGGGDPLPQEWSLGVGTNGAVVWGSF